VALPRLAPVALVHLHPSQARPTLHLNSRHRGSQVKELKMDLLDGSGG
jgi:hypothetical protein